MESRHVPDLVDLTDEVDPTRDHIRGRADAPVTLVEYGDYECPFCARAEPVVRRLLHDFGDDLRHVWRHLPGSLVHPHAELAAEAAEAAAAHGVFWAMHDTLIAHQDELEPHHLGRYARELGVDVDRFREALMRHVYAERVARDVVSAEASGALRTPTFFVNGKRHAGAYDFRTLAALVRDALRVGESPA
jgi:protein-disulfide isomerase